MANGREARRTVGPRSGAGSAPEVITSRDNRWLKEFRVALRGGVPTTSGAVGVEGVRLVEEALTSGCRVEAVLFGESGERYRERLAPLIGRPEMGFPVLRTTDRLFEGLADTEHPQGVAALVVPRTWTLEEVLEGRGERGVTSDEEGEIRNSKLESREDEHAGLKPGATQVCAPLIVVLAGVQDPGNVGTILRTAAAFGATAAVTAATGQSGTASPFAPKALRASAGATLHLPIVAGMALGILLTQLKLRGIRTLASCVEEEKQWRVAGGEWREDPREAPHSADSVRNDVIGQGAMSDGHEVREALAPWEVDWCEAVALLVGNEGAGLPEDVVRGADARVHIPMAGQVESLNAAAAAAVVLYEAFRQRTSKAVASE
ncbi:MAG TPA: RNA methyltransferase [Dongiaceae bacterium]|nr:RNA methyltransferase [Dongiaceae bacterium]